MGEPFIDIANAILRMLLTHLARLPFFSHGEEEEIEVPLPSRERD
jgi:hypothetical protein